MDLSPKTHFMNFLEYFKYFKVIFFGKMLYLIAFLFSKTKQNHYHRDLQAATAIYNM